MALRRFAQRLSYYRHGLGPGAALGLFLVDALAKLGVRAYPYYVVVEGPSGPPPPLPDPGDVFVELEAADMDAIHALMGVPPTPETLRQWLAQGRRGFGVKRHGRLIAFNWCTFDHASVDKAVLFRLPPGTAYLFWMWTDHAARGGGVAPFLRYHTYAALRAAGCHKLYSISLVFNRPSLRFKQKLNAEIVGRGFLLNLFGRRWKVFGWQPDR